MPQLMHKENGPEGNSAEQNQTQGIGRLNRVPRACLGRPVCRGSLDNSSNTETNSNSCLVLHRGWPVVDWQRKPVQFGMNNPSARHYRCADCAFAALTAEYSGTHKLSLGSVHGKG